MHIYKNVNTVHLVGVFFTVFMWSKPGDPQRIHVHDYCSMWIKLVRYIFNVVYSEGWNSLQVFYIGHICILESCFVPNQLFQQDTVEQSIHVQFSPNPDHLSPVSFSFRTGIKTTRAAEPLWYPKISSARPAEPHEAEPSARQLLYSERSRSR